MKIKYRLFWFFLSALLLLGGCNLIPFEDPEVQRQKAEAAATVAVIQLADPKAALEGDRVYHRELRNQAGALLAVYEGRMPQFSETGEHGEVFAQINSHYDLEFAQCADDCDSLFQVVRRHHGEEWDVLESVEGVFTVYYSYRLLDTPEKYICIQKQYSYRTEGGGGYTRYYPDVFLAENGWRLSFDSLFGHNADVAAQLVLSGIRAWCEQNGVAHEKLDGLAAATFTEFYAMDAESLIFYAEPFLLSTNDGASYTIPLSLEAFEALLIE